MELKIKKFIKNKKPGIFCVENFVNSKKFIGYSKIGKYYKSDIYGQLRRGVFKNWKLQEDWNKYGEKSFEFNIIEENSGIGWIERKQYYMDLYKTCETGYNIRPKADLSEIASGTKEKMSKAQEGEKNHRFGKKMSSKEKQIRSEKFSGEKNPNYGKKHSSKIRKKISKKATGRKMSEEAKRKISKYKIGKKNSEESKKKNSDKAVKRWKDPEFRKKMIESFKGRIYPEDLGKRISEGKRKKEV